MRCVTSWTMYSPSVGRPSTFPTCSSRVTEYPQVRDAISSQHASSYRSWAAPVVYCVHSLSLYFDLTAVSVTVLCNAALTRKTSGSNFMAQKTIVQLIDDLDGTSSNSIDTITFGLDGVTYEIDLNEDNASKLRDSLTEFVDAARRTGGRVKRSTGPVASRSANGSGRSREQTQAIREWARNNDWEIADRGRIPADIIEAFEGQAGKKIGRRSK